MGKHAILVIKNKKSEYLQYYDEKWNSYLFLNCKMNDANDKESIIEKITNDFNISKDKIELNLIGEKKHKKFSESAKIEKEYIHYFYDVKLNREFDNRSFKINNIDYRWFSYEELLKDERIQKVNSDIVGFIKEFKM